MIKSINEMRNKKIEDGNEAKDRLSYVAYDEDGVYDECNSFFTLDEILFMRDYYNIEF